MEIKNLVDVTNFFKYLKEERKVIFHPDDDFKSYVNIETLEPAFTPEECKEYNDSMLKCFDVCEAEGVDIYLIGLEIQKQ